MNKYVKSSDGISIHYQITASKPIAIVFVHGWLGNAKWWDGQRSYFANKYTVVQMDLPGHGKSNALRKNWSSTQYAEDIRAVVDKIESQKIILVGHSMSGAYALESSLYIPKVKAIILVDTLKNMEQLMNYEQADELLFTPYRKDFKSAVESMLPPFLFAKSTPLILQQRLQSEFLRNDSGFAIKSIEPLYKMDIRNIAQLIKIPVRAINSDFTPTNCDNNLKYFRDYKYSSITGTGHYPMLERPNGFNMALDEVLQKLSI